MNIVLGSRTPGERTFVTALKFLLAVFVLGAVVMLQASAFSSPAHATTAEAAKAKKKKAKKVKKPAAPQTCIDALKGVNAALRARAVPRYRLKTAKTAKQRRKYKKQVKKADKRVSAARAALKVQCQGSGTTSALDAECSYTITKLEKTIGLRYERKMKLTKIKGNSRKAKQRRKAMRKRLKKIDDQIKIQTASFAKSCDKTGNGGGSGGNDTTAPGAPTVSGPVGPTNDTTPRITVTTTEPGGVIQCRLNGGAWQTAYRDFEVPALADGTYLLECRQIDEADNVGQPGQTTLTIDTTPPGAVTISGPVGSTSDTTPTLTITPPAGETGGHIECQIDGGDWITVESPWTTPVLSEGTHTITCRYVDAAGNAGGAASTVVTVDTSVPDTTAPGAPTVSGPTGPTNDTTPTVTVTTTEPGGTIECRLDGGDWEAGYNQFDLPELTDGSHLVECRQTDDAGNASEPGSATIVIDTSAPDAAPTIDVPGSGSGGENNGDNPEVIVTPPGGETGGHLECKISGSGYDGEFADFITVTSPWTLPSLPEGTWTITCHYVDEAGNNGPDSQYTLVIDRTAPGAPTITGPTGPTNDTTPSITVATAEPGGTIQCRLDGGDWQTAYDQFDLPELTDGSHLVECRQIDDAGNASGTGSATVIIDTTAPGAVAISGPSGATSDTTPSFNLSGAEAGDRYECATDGGEITETGNVYTTAALTDGTHIISCRLVDAAGNEGPVSSVDVTIDTQAPGSVTISGPGVTNSATPTITITSSATGGHIECRIDDGAWQTVTSPWTLPALGEGTHVITCHYVSGTGVTGADSSYTVTIDTTPPSAVTMTGLSGLTNDNTPTYTLGGGIGGSFQCAVDGGAWGAATSPYTTAVLADGPHTIACRAVDQAGNATAAVSRSVTVDTAAPALTIADGAVRWDGRHNFTFITEAGATVRCKVDDGAYATVTSPFTTAELANGSHTLSCTASDVAGNVSAPVVKPFGVFKDPVTVSKTGGFQWSIGCIGSFGCPQAGLSITIPANPNGITGNYLVDLKGEINNLSSTLGLGSTYTMHIVVDGGSVASDSAVVWFDIFGVFHADLSALKNDLTLSASQSHTIQLTLKSSSLSLLPWVGSSKLEASIHH